MWWVVKEKAIEPRRREGRKEGRFIFLNNKLKFLAHFARFSRFSGQQPMDSQK